MPPRSYFMQNDYLCDTGRRRFHLSGRVGGLMLRQLGPRGALLSAEELHDSWHVRAFPPPTDCCCSPPAPTDVWSAVAISLAVVLLLFRGVRFFRARTSRERVRPGKKYSPRVSLKNTSCTRGKPFLHFEES